MNSLLKSLTVIFLAVSIFISGLSADQACGQPPVAEPMVNLTPEEQAWLARHPEIVLGTTTEYSPMAIKRVDGTYAGVLLDIYEKLSRRLDTSIRLHIEDPWAEVQAKAKTREIDGLAMGGRDPNRERLFNATDVLIPTYFSVFGRSQNEYDLKRFADLAGMRTGFKRAARPTRSLLEKLPSAVLKPYDSHESMTQALLSREIDVIVAWISYDHWRKEKLQGTIDNILLITEYPIEMVAHVRNDWPELIPILNKAIAALQKDELPLIINKWFGQWPIRSAASVTFTSEERAWLDKAHIVRVRVADWPPYLIVKDNEPPQGIVIEYLRLIGERAGITFKHEITDQPFAEFLESMKLRQGPDMTAVIVPTPEREQYLSFSKT